MSRSDAARAVGAFADGDPDLAAAILNDLTHAHAIACLLEVAALTARFAAEESGIPAGALLDAIAQHP